MRAVMILGAAVGAVALTAGVVLLVGGCTLKRPAGHGVAAVQEPDVIPPPRVQRVGGDTAAAVEFNDGIYRSGQSRITTPLPEGYPPPTPPGAIDLKSYPLVRRAEISGSITPDWGMNFAFFPLFNHIKRRDIEMTSPVEVNYDGLDDGGSRPAGWTMSFLYRTPELGPTGIDPKDQRVLIEDIPPVTVVAVGLKGPYRMNRVNEGLGVLRDWLAGQSDWEPAGEPRALFYNGPEAPGREKWAEVQIPVRRASSGQPAGN